MSLAFLPLAFGIMSVHSLPAGTRLALAIVVVGLLWWGPFYTLGPQGQTSDETQRIGMLAQLGQLHRQGVLTDDEFAAQKAQVLGE
jgi:Short C-terminal domain